MWDFLSCLGFYCAAKLGGQDAESATGNDSELFPEERQPSELSWSSFNDLKARHQKMEVLEDGTKPLRQRTKCAATPEFLHNTALSATAALISPVRLTSPGRLYFVMMAIGAGRPIASFGKVPQSTPPLAVSSSARASVTVRRPALPIIRTHKIPAANNLLGPVRRCTRKFMTISYFLRCLDNSIAFAEVVVQTNMEVRIVSINNF
jgi:hypothetical protein